MSDATRYRSGVGIVLLNRQGLIFAGHRRDNRDCPWQLPQGGLNQGELPEQAVFREMNEELGTRHAMIIQSRSDWLRYDYPSLQTSPRARHFKGQQHLWFLLRYLGEDHEINLETKHPEFSHWVWMRPCDVIDKAVPFKRQIYQRIMADFAEPIHRLTTPSMPELGKRHDQALG